MSVSPPSIQLRAGGNITPFRIVKIGTTQDSEALISASATSPNIGIAHGGTRRAPGTGDDDGFAAIDGENIPIWGTGCIGLVQLVGTSARGDAITSDASGLGTTTTTEGDCIVGWALQSGVAGDVVRVLVNPCYLAT